VELKRNIYLLTLWTIYDYRVKCRIPGKST
jgi:hypothetical protein